MPDIKTLKKFGIVGWAIMECMFFAGLLYGWPSLNFVLKSEGIYADLCEEFSDDSHSRNDSVVVNNISPAGTAPTTNTTYKLTSDIPMQSMQKVCKKQDDRMFICFMIGIFAFGVGCLIFGWIILKLKTKISRCISCIIFIIGTVLMVFIGQEVPWLMFIGLPLMTIGGTPVFMTNIQVSNLFPSRSSTIVGLLCGAFDVSSGVMLLVKVAHDNGFDRMNMFIIITVLHLMILVSTKKFLQNDPVQGQNNQEQESLRSYLKKQEFQLHIIWLSILQLRFFYYLGTLNSYLNRIFDDDEKEVSKWTNYCQYTMLFGILSSPVAGLLYDKLKKCYNQDGSNRKYKKLMPAVVPLAVASGLSLLLSVLAFILDERVLIPSFTVLTLHRSFLYSIAAGFISEIYPENHFGILFGKMMFVGGITNLLFYPLSHCSEKNSASAKLVNGFLLGTVLLSFTHPFCLYMRARQKMRNGSQSNFEEVSMNQDL